MVRMKEAIISLSDGEGLFQTGPPGTGNTEV